MADLEDEFESMAGDTSQPIKPLVRPGQNSELKKPKPEATKKVAPTKKTKPEVGKKAKPEAEPEPTVVRRPMISMADNRKLNKQEKETVRQRWSASNGAESRSKMMASLLDQGRDKFGADRVFGSREELAQLAIGIPTPSLAFEYLIANDVFPLSSIMMLAGSWGSCKSALSYEFFRWFYERNGIAVHIDTEDKFDADFACDIMRVQHDQTPIISNRANSVEVMQQILSYYVTEMQRKMLDKTSDPPGPGKTVPICFCIDSLAGATSEEIQEKIRKDGMVGRSHPINALKNSNYLPGIKRYFEGWPFTLLIVNHLKEKTDDMGNTHQYTLGGQTFNFHESFELRNSVWKSKFKNSQFEGIGIKIACSKNSFGPTGRAIKTRFLWWIEDDPETGRPRDVFMWDWNWSICTLLNELDGTARQRLKDRELLIDCKSPTADIECLANFRAVGMAKGEYLPFQEVGQMIQDNEEVCERIRDALNIKRRVRLELPFDDLVAQHKQQAE